MRRRAGSTFLMGASVLLMGAWVFMGWLTTAPATAAVTTGKPKPVDFNRDILPILSDNCFTCHGPDANKRDADLRLDTREGVFADRGGYQTVKPGDSAASELYLRVSTADDFDLMPPSSSNHKLMPTQVDLIKRWTDEGANSSECCRA